jgi:hypothetical protein
MMSLRFKALEQSTSFMVFTLNIMLLPLILQQLMQEFLDLFCSLSPISLSMSFGGKQMDYE